MESASRIDAFLSTLSVAVRSKDGGLGALAGASEAVDIPKLCRLDLQESAEVSLLQLALEASGADLVVDAVGLAGGLPMAMVMALQHPQMHLLDLAETVEALAVVMVALL